MRYAKIATITVMPLLRVLSLSHAKKNTTGNVRKFPIAARAFAWTLEKPSPMTMLGVYVVKGLQVAKTDAVARKWGHLLILNRVAKITFVGIFGVGDFSLPDDSSSSQGFSYLSLSGRKVSSTIETTIVQSPSTIWKTLDLLEFQWTWLLGNNSPKKIHCQPERLPLPSNLNSPAPNNGPTAVPPNMPKKNIAIRRVISSVEYHCDNVNIAPGMKPASASPKIVLVTRNPVRSRINICAAATIPNIRTWPPIQKRGPTCF